MSNCTMCPDEVVLGRYRVEGFIGAGGMGAVYRARHVEEGFPVALKVLTAHHRVDLIRRFQREARLLASVRHRNVVAILDYGVLEDGCPCIAMELVEGEGLERALQRLGALDWPDATAVAMGILEGLEAIHAQGILHRDLKPSNVLVASSDPPVPKLIDLGIARPEDDSATRFTGDGVLVGTPTYMSPEQVLGHTLDRRSDLYSVGMILHELLTGTVPFGDLSLAGALRRIHQAIPRLHAPRGRPDLPPALEEAVRDVLASDPSRRPASAAGLRQRLENLLPQGGSPAGWRPERSSERTSGQTAPPFQHQVSDELRALSSRTGGHASDTMFVDDMDEVSGGLSSPIVTASRPPPVPSPPATTPSGQTRFMLVARLPPSRLSNDEERRWLAGVSGAEARAFVVGAGLWVTLQLRATSLDAAADQAAGLARTLRDRYGPLVRLEWTTVGAGFVVPAAALVGGQALPDELTTLIGRVTAA